MSVERRRVQVCIGATDSMLRPALFFLPSSFIFPAQRLKVPAECWRTYNVPVLHLSPLLSDDRRSYTYKQSNTHKMTSNNGICVLWKQELEDFHQSSSDEDGGIFFGMSSKAKLRSKTRLGKRGGSGLYLWLSSAAAS